MQVHLTERAREHVRQLARGRNYRSPAAVVEAALWGPDGPERELSDQEWNRALDRDRWALTRPERGRSAEEVVTNLRGLIAQWKQEQDEWDKNETVPAVIHLSDEAFRYIDAFVKAGMYASPEDAVERTLLSALELAPPGTDGSQIKALVEDEPEF